MRLKKRIKAYFDSQIEKQELPGGINSEYSSVPVSGPVIPDGRKAFIQSFMFNTGLVFCLVFLLVVNTNLSQSLQDRVPFNYELREVREEITRSLERFHASIKQAYLGINTDKNRGGTQ